MSLSENNDQIFIRGLKVQCYIGVPDQEREQSQELLINVIIEPKVKLDNQPLNDDISMTIDYHAVALKIEEVAKDRPRRLIETLSEDIAGAILNEFAVVKVTVEIEKFILPNTRCVGVIISRKKSSP